MERGDKAHSRELYDGDNECEMKFGELCHYAILWSTTAGLLPQPVLISNCMSLLPTNLQFTIYVYNIGDMILFTSIPSINPLSSPLPDCAHSSHVTRYWDGEVVSESHDQRGPAISADTEVSRVSHFPWLHGIRSGDVTFSTSTVYICKPGPWYCHVRYNWWSSFCR